MSQEGSGTSRVHVSHEPDETEALTALMRCVEILNSGALALMIATGHRLGLFDVLAGLHPSSSVQIAERAGLEERYVREWLAAMTTGGLVTYDPDDETYALVPAYAGCLTAAAEPRNLARTIQFIPLLGGVSGEVAECFRTGGGVPYESYAGFHDVMEEASVAVADAVLIDEVLPLIPDLPERLRAGIEVADIGCGSGYHLNLLATSFPASSFVGYDFSSEAIERARHKATELGLSNIRFEVRDVAELGRSEAFDLVTAFDAIHDQARPADVLDTIHTALRPGGRFLMADFRASSHLEDNLDHPVGPFLYTVSTLHCMTVSLALDGAGLGTAWGEQRAQQMLREAGFDDIELAYLDDDPVNTYYLAHKQ